MEQCLEKYLITAGGKIKAPRCQARSKRHGEQCGAPAMRDKRVCRFHGGKSTGPTTEAGKKRIAESQTVHGRESRAIRQNRSQKAREMKELQKLMKRLWMT